MSVMTVQQSIYKANMDLVHCQQQYATCYTLAQRHSLALRMAKLQTRLQYLQVKLQREIALEQQRRFYKQRVAHQRAFNATYNTLKPRRGTGRRYY